MPHDHGPVFIADTCIGGLSVLKSMWRTGCAADAIFMADYAVNPLGVKSDSEISQVVNSWLRAAEAHSDTLVIACNTLSIRYHQLTRASAPRTTLKRIVTMVDCLEAMAAAEAARIANHRVLVIGTAFTARQQLYPDILGAVPGTRISTIAATELERQIARLELDENDGDGFLTGVLGRAIAESDVAVLACTCFPMIRTRLEALFPGVIFLDPGAYSSGLLKRDEMARNRKLTISVTGDVVTKSRVIEFARTYLGSDAVA